MNGEFKPVQEYFGEEVSEEDSKNGVQPTPIYYVSDEIQQAQYISMFKDAGLDALVCDTYIDPHFVSYIEYKNPKKVRFVRIDADIDGALKSGETLKEEDNQPLIDAFKKHLVNQSITVKVERFKSGKMPAIVNVDEFMRRMSEMNGFYGMGDIDAAQYATLVLNLTNPVISSLLAQSEEKQKVIVNQVYYMAMLSYKQLSPEELSNFIDASAQILFDYCK